MKKSAVLAALFILALVPSSGAMGNSQQDNTTGGGQVSEEARESYRAYIAQLKELSRQYGQITSQVSKVIKEEGVPTWDESTGTIKMSHDVNFSSAASASGDVKETENEIRIIVEAPGLKKDSIRVEIENEKLVRVRAVKKALEAGGSEQPFESSYQLSSSVQDKNAAARYEDGILTVTLKKIPVSKKIVPVTVR